MFKDLEAINERPKPFEFYTAADLWTDAYTSEQMLSYHLNEGIDLSSRNSAFIDRSVDWIASRFDLKGGTKIVDFGCGPGLYTIRLARRGSAVTGVDFSNRSIQYAQGEAGREGLAIDYKHQDYLTFKTEKRFHLILMIMCDFCALNPDQRKKMLNMFHSVLAPGGSVLLDVYSLKAFEKRSETSVYEADLLNGFWAADRYYGFLNTFKYEKEKIILDKYTLVEARRTRTVYNWLQYFSRNTLKEEFENCGFKIEEFYTDVAGEPFNSRSDEIAVVARKL